MKRLSELAAWTSSTLIAGCSAQVSGLSEHVSQAADAGPRVRDGGFAVEIPHVPCNFLERDPNATCAWEPTFTPLPSGDVLISGGFGLLEPAEHGLRFATGFSEIYRADSGRFEQVGSLNFPRIGHATVALPSGEVLVLGGHALALPLEEPWGSERIALVEEIEVFDGVSSFRRLEHDLPFPRSDSSAFRTVSGEIVVVGGVAKTVGYSLENDGLWPGQDCGWPDCSVEANRPVVWLSEAGITLAVTFREANFTLRTPPMVELDPGILVLGGSGTTTEVTTELLTEDDWISHPVISSLNKPRYVGAGVKLGVRFDDYRALVVSRGLIATLEMPSGRLTDIADLTGTYSEGGWSVHWEGLVPVSPERFLLVGHSQRDGFMSKFVETSSVGTATITDAPSPLSRRDDAILTALGDGRAVRWGGWPWQSGIPAHRDIDRSRVLEIYDPRAHGFYLASETPNNR